MKLPSDVMQVELTYFETYLLGIIPENGLIYTKKTLELTAIKASIMKISHDAGIFLPTN